MLARLHGANAVHGRLAHRPLEVPERALLVEAMDQLFHPWEGGPFSESARSGLARHVRRVNHRLDLLDQLVVQLGESDENVVVTHGEPHPGNFIHLADGIRLIDWDTIALARPERDLWMFGGGSSASFAYYEELTGSRINDTAIAFHRLAWTLSDIASLVDLFRSDHQETQWTRNKLNTLQQLLAGAFSAPHQLASEPVERG